MKKYFKDIHNEEYVCERINIDYVGYNQCVSKTYRYNEANDKDKEYIIRDTYIRGSLKYRNVTKYVVEDDGRCYIIIHNLIKNIETQETVYRDTYDTITK